MRWQRNCKANHIPKLQVLSKCQGAVSGDIAVGLEHVHGEGLSGEDGTSEELGL